MQIREPGIGPKLGIGWILLLAIGLAVVFLGSSASAAEQVEVASYGTPGAAADQLESPGGVAVEASTGDFYVADTVNQRVDKFGPGGEFLLAWGWGVKDGTAKAETCTTACQAGVAGSGAGQLEAPRSIAISPAGEIYVASQGDGRIQRFTSAGKYKGSFGGFGTGTGQFTFPFAEGNDLAIDSSGRVFVSDANRKAGARIAIFSPTGTYTGAIESEPGRRLSYFGPLAVGTSNELFVGSISSGGVSVYSAAGAFVRVIGSGLTVGGLAVDPTNGNLLIESVSGYDSSATFTLGEYTTSGTLIGATQIPLTAATSQYGQVGLAYDAAPAANQAGYAPGLVLAADTNGGRVLGLAEPAPEAPGLYGVGVSANDGDGANISGQVEPHGLATAYHVEYGTTAAYGATTPTVTLPATHQAVHAVAHLAGLTPGTTYHFTLVAQNALGRTQSADSSFTALAAGSPFALPDGRAYEMVSPPGKNNSDIEGHGIAAANGEAVTFTSLNGLPGAESGGLYGGFVASRGGSGWSNVPAAPVNENENTILSANPLAFSADLRQDLVTSTLNLTGNAPPGNNLYLRTNPSAPGAPASEQLITTEAGRSACGYQSPVSFVGASTDFRHLVFTDGDALTPASTPISNEVECAVPQLYEWSEGTLRNIGILPGASAPSPTGATAVAGAGMVSADGSKVYFTSTPAPVAKGEAPQPQLFLRSGGTTVRVSASKLKLAEPNAAPAKFQSASADGSVVYFTDASRLTANASPTGSDLYRYVVVAGELTDLTPTAAAAEARQALASADGKVVYFGATGKLAAGATEEGSNLYRLQTGGSPQFIGELAPGDSFITSSVYNPITASTRTTADGGVLLLTAESALGTGAENLGISGFPVNEIYRYAVGGGFACVSCENRGEGVAGAQISGPQYPGSAGDNVLSSDGSRVFFETSDALVSQDVDGANDVYEWEGGAVHLISTGTSGAGSSLVDADATGNNVFFATRQQLVKADQDEKIDVYDARVGGGFAEAPAAAPPCEAEACRSASAAAPAAPSLASRTFVGPHKGKHKKKRHRKRHQKRRHQKAKHAKKHRGHGAGTRGGNGR